MTRITRILPVLTFMTAVVACGGGGPSPSEIDTTGIRAK